MRAIRYIVVHCTATPQNTTIESIRNYWRNDLGWSNVGYHYMIQANGKIVQIADESLITNGVRGYNKDSIHVCWIGGKIKDNRTKQQREALIRIISELKAKYPQAIIQGHRDFPGVTKACPQFDAKTEYKNIG